jgi:Antitoxin-like ribbon-helix-helix
MTISMSKRAPLSFKVEKVAPVPASGNQTSLPANTKTHKRAKGKTKTGRDGRQFIAGHVLPDAAKQFKLLAVQQGKTTQELLIEAINDLFAKYELSRIA